MKVPKKDIEALKYLGAKSKQNKEEIKKAIDLYQKRKIERFDTALQIITNLSSKGEINQQTAKNKLKFYEDEYIPRREALANPLPSGYTRFIKPPKDINTGKDFEITTGNMGSVNSYINIKILKNVLNMYGNEIRTFREIISRSTILKIYEEIGKILAIKKVAKVKGTI